MDDIERRIELRRKKHKRDKRAAILILVALVLIVLGTFSALAASYDKIYRGVSVCGIELGGKTTEEAYNALSEAFGEEVPEIEVSAGKAKEKIAFSDVAAYDFMKTAENAYQKGRSNFFSSFVTYISPFAKREGALFADVNAEALEGALSELQAKVSDGYRDTTYKTEGDELVILTGHSGKAIDTQKLQKEIISCLEKHENAVLTAETTERKYKSPTADEIYDEVYCEPEDAYFDKATNRFVEHKDGYDFDKKQATEILKNAKPDSEYKIPLKVVHPKKTTSALESEMFSDLLGSYTTNYNASNTNRSHNVALAASKFNGYVMMPGAVFSYNGVVGDRTVAAGYKNAAVYTSNGVEDGIGGGICQVSSTLYNAVLYANLEIVSRTNHSYPVSYAPKGQDATVSMGSIDFKFKNNAENPIMLKTSVGGGRCTVSVYGKKTKNFSVSVESTVLSTNPYTTEYIDDPTMPEGEEKVVREGITGYSVRTVRHVTVDGKTTTQTMPKSNYVTLSKKVKRGTKPKAEPETGAETKPPENSDTNSGNDAPSGTTDTPQQPSDSGQGSDLSGWAE